MRPDLLHVVTCVSNPIRWASRIALYKRFEAHMLASGVRLTTVECAFGDRPHELASAAINHVPVRAKTLVWTKENLLNIGLSRLPDEAKYVAFIDADVTFRKAGWASETLHALQQYDVVQPWSDAYDLGPNDDHLQVHRSLARLWHDGAPIQVAGKGPYQFGHPGYAWAWTRQALEWVGGLLEICGLGAADHHMGLGLIDRADESFPGGLTPAYVEAVMTWQARAKQHIGGNLSYVPGTIEHGWHGSKDRRRYVERWEVLSRHRFDPTTDLKRNTHGVFELAGNKPAFRMDVDRYFRARNEDSVDV